MRGERRTSPGIDKVTDRAGIRRRPLVMGLVLGGYLRRGIIEIERAADDVGWRPEIHPLLGPVAVIGDHRLHGRRAHLAQSIPQTWILASSPRSEERRVGKECR